MIIKSWWISILKSNLDVLVLWQDCILLDHLLFWSQLSSNDAKSCHWFLRTFFDYFRVIEDPAQLRFLLIEVVQLYQVVWVDWIVEETVFVRHAIEGILRVHPESNPRAQATLLLLDTRMVSKVKTMVLIVHHKWIETIAWGLLPTCCEANPRCRFVGELLAKSLLMVVELSEEVHFHACEAIVVVHLVLQGLARHPRDLLGCSNVQRLVVLWSIELNEWISIELSIEVISILCSGSHVDTRASIVSYEWPLHRFGVTCSIHNRIIGSLHGLQLRQSVNLFAPALQHIIFVIATSLDTLLVLMEFLFIVFEGLIMLSNLLNLAEYIRVLIDKPELRVRHHLRVINLLAVIFRILFDSPVINGDKFWLHRARESSSCAQSMVPSERYGTGISQELGAMCSCEHGRICASCHKHDCLEPRWDSAAGVVPAWSAIAATAVPACTVGRCTLGGSSPSRM